MELRSGSLACDLPPKRRSCQFVKLTFCSNSAKQGRALRLNGWSHWWTSCPAKLRHARQTVWIEVVREEQGDDAPAYVVFAFWIICNTRTIFPAVGLIALLFVPFAHRTRRARCRFGGFLSKKASKESSCSASCMHLVVRGLLSRKLATRLKNERLGGVCLSVLRRQAPGHFHLSNKTPGKTMRSDALHGCAPKRAAVQLHVRLVKHDVPQAGKT